LVVGVGQCGRRIVPEVVGANLLLLVKGWLVFPRLQSHYQKSLDELWQSNLFVVLWPDVLS